MSNTYKFNFVYMYIQLLNCECILFVTYLPPTAFLYNRYIYIYIYIFKDIIMIISVYKMFNYIN